MCQKAISPCLLFFDDEDGYGEDAPPVPLPRRGPGSKYDRDPRLTGIVRRRRKYEARIAGGRSGCWVYLGLFATVDEAIGARRRALAQRRVA